MVAGEASGDLLAGLLLDGLLTQWPDLTSSGIGGPQMSRRGFQALWPHHKLSVHGYGWDVLMRYREIVGIRKQLKTQLLQTPQTCLLALMPLISTWTLRPISRPAA